MRGSPGRVRVAVAAIALFVLGATVGIATDRLLHGRSPAAAVRLPDGTTLSLADLEADPIGAIDRAVGLRPEQRTRLAEIIERRQSHLDAGWHEARSHLRATIDSVFSEIAAELDPDQAARFRALYYELHGPLPGEHLFPR